MNVHEDREDLKKKEEEINHLACGCSNQTGVHKSLFKNRKAVMQKNNVNHNWIFSIGKEDSILTTRVENTCRMKKS